MKAAFQNGREKKVKLWWLSDGVTFRKTLVRLEPMQLLGPPPKEHSSCSWPALLGAHTFTMLHKHTEISSDTVLGEKPGSMSSSF